MKARLILNWVTDRDVTSAEIDGISECLNDAGYLLFITKGKVESLRILSPKKMRRSDYAACVNAAKAMQKELK